MELTKRKLPNVITSFNAEGYRRYGKAFLESWIECWPKSIRLTVFYEGDEFGKEIPFTEGLSWRPIEEVEFLTDFLKGLHFPIMHGIVGDKYDINFDARQARKVFMEADAARNLYGGKVFWIDADSFTHTAVPEGWLDQCLPDDRFCCYLGRDGWYFTESGFIGFNTDHPIAQQFFRSYVHVYISGVIFTMSPQHDEKMRYVGGGWHDCIGFDAVRSMASKDGHQHAFVNLAANVPKGTMHPFINGVPGAYLDHRKGNRKEEGSSKRKDLTVERTEPYWLRIQGAGK